MADRTGIAELDALIEGFLREPIRDGGEIYGDDTIATLRDPQQAHGNCQAIAEQFEAFAAARGFKIYSTDTDLEELGYQATGDGGEVGFDEHGEMQYGFYPEHTVNSYYPEGQVWPIIIDFTASQYGYTDHPKVTV